MIGTRAVSLLIAGLVILIVLLPFPDDPGNRYGMALGIVGTAMMVVMHGYTFRKKRWIGFGRVPGWLSFHIVMGLVGPALIIVHSGMSFRGIAGFAALLMVAEVISGVTGRYIYMQIPRSKRGKVKDLKEIEKEEEALTERLEKALGSDEELWGLVSPPPEDAGFLRLILTDVRNALIWPIRMRRVPREKRGTIRDARELVKRRNKLRRNIAALDRFRTYLENWRTVHIPVASVFLLLIAIHIVNIFYY